MEQQYRDIEKKLESYYRREGKELPLPRDTELRAMKEMAPSATRIRITARYLGKVLAACLSLAIVVSAVVYLPGRLSNGFAPGGLGETADSSKDDAPQTDTVIGIPLPETDLPNGNEAAGDGLFNKESFKPLGTGSTMEGISEVSLVEYTVKDGHLTVTLSFVNGTGKSLGMDADYGVQYYNGEAWQDCATNEHFHGFYDLAYELFEDSPWRESYAVSVFDVSRPGLYRLVKYLGFGTEDYVWVEFELTEGFKADPDNGYVDGDEVTWGDSIETVPMPDTTVDMVTDVSIPDTTDVVEPAPSVIVDNVVPFFAEEALYLDPPNLWIDEDTGHLMLALYAMNPREEAYIMNGPYWHLMIWRDGGWTSCPAGALGGITFPDVEVPIEGLMDWQLTCDLSEAYDLSEAGRYRFVKDAICAVEFELTEGLPTIPKPDSPHPDPYPDGMFDSMEIFRTDGTWYKGTDGDIYLNKFYYILSEMKNAEGSESREVVINGKPDYIISITYQNGVTEDVALYSGGESFYTWGEVLGEAVITVHQNSAMVDEALTYLRDVIFDEGWLSDVTVPADSVDVPVTVPYDTEDPIPETSPVYDETEDVAYLLECGVTIPNVDVLEPSLWIDGDELFIKVGFVNKTGGNLYLNAYYDLQYWQDGQWVSTYGPGGPLVFSEYVMEIGDGDTWSEVYKLAYDFDLSRPGNYRFVKALDLLVEFRLPYGLELAGQGTDVIETLPPVVEPDELPGEIVDVGFKVVTGNQNSIVPLSGMLSTTIVTELPEGTEVTHGDGFGVLGQLIEHLMADTIPELEYEGDLEVAFAGENYALSGVWLLHVQDVDGGISYEQERTTLEALSELPAGRYYVGLWVTESWGSHGLNKTCTEALFELIIP